jgi:NTE family protein
MAGSKTGARQKRRINLALQGGGAHGAFTWGVIDRLMEEDWLEIEGISGASAGAVNAAILSSALAGGTPQKGLSPRAVAKVQLEGFWKRISRDGGLPPLQRAIIERLFSFDGIERNPIAQWWKAWASFYSPYDWAGLDLARELTATIDEFVDFDAIKACTNHQLFISATNVETGKLRVFSRGKASADVVMASACLPTLFKAVVIEGVPYWDGGYMGNPPIFPFFRTSTTEDVLLVQINPARRMGAPETSTDIASRLNEISFNAPLLAEFRAIDFVVRLIDEGKLDRGTGPGQYRRINLHRIQLQAERLDLSARTKTRTDYSFFLALREEGRAAAQHWLANEARKLGSDIKLDIAADIAAEWDE